MPPKDTLSSLLNFIMENQLQGRDIEELHAKQPTSWKREMRHLPQIVGDVDDEDFIAELDDAWEWIQDWYDSPATLSRMLDTGYSEPYIQNILDYAAPQVQLGKSGLELGTKTAGGTLPAEGIDPNRLPYNTDATYEQGVQKQLDYMAGKKQLPYNKAWTTAVDVFLSPEEYNDRGSTVPEHEFEHYLNFGNKDASFIYNLIPEERRFISGGERGEQHEVFDAKLPDTKDEYFQAYIAEPTETRARLMEIRRELGVQPGQVITDEMLNTLRGGSEKDTEIHGFRGRGSAVKDLLEVFPKKSILTMLNTLAAGEDTRTINDYLYEFV